MANPTKIVWRGLLWAIPVALIVLGLAFVYASLTGNDKADLSGAGPANMREVSAAHANGWARRQAEAVGANVRTSQLSIVSQNANSATVYTVVAVVVQVNEKPVSGDQPAQVTTITSCVEWRVDTASKIVDELNAAIMRTETGAFPDLVDEKLRSRCDVKLFG